MHSFPIVGRNHFNSIPGTAVEECAVGSFADAFLAADTEVRINFDPAKRWVIVVRDPEHAGFDRTVLDTGRRTRAAGAAIGSDGQNTWPLLARGFAVTLRHRPMLFYDIEHALLPR